MLRTDPLLMNAVEVHAIGGTGIFAFIDDAVRQARAGSSTRRRSERQGTAT